MCIDPQCVGHVFRAFGVAGVPDELKGKTRSEVCSLAILDPEFWAYLAMLDVIASMLRTLHHWVEWCPCHGDHILLLDDLDLGSNLREELVQLWSQCPLRGCRAPCLAAGEFTTLVRQVGDVSAATLMLSFPSDITAQQRQKLVLEFNMGRSHLEFYFGLKLHHWTQPPWLVYKLAHHDEILAAEAYGELMSCSDPHPLVERLKAEPLCSEGMLWMGGSSLGDVGLENLTIFVSKLRFAWTAERRIEARIVK